MKPAALGFRVHSGWTSLIALAIENNQPIILARQRPHLVATFSYTFRQPYHTAEKMNLTEAQTFLDQQRDEARVFALSALRAAQTKAAQQGYKVNRAALLLASGRPLPELRTQSFRQRTRQTFRLPLDSRRKIRHPSRLALARGDP